MHVCVDSDLLNGAMHLDYCVSSIHQMSDILSSRQTALQSLVKYLDQRIIEPDTVCSHARVWQAACIYCIWPAKQSVKTVLFMKGVLDESKQSRALVLAMLLLFTV